MSDQLTLIIAVLGLLLTAGGVVAALHALISKSIAPLQKTADETARAVVEIRTGLYGATGQNGIRSEVRELQQDVKSLRKELVDVRIGFAEHEHEH